MADSVSDTGSASAPRATVIVPTLREARNLPRLAAELGAVRERAGLDLELLVVDDDSRDGTVEWAAGAPPWVRLHVRTRDPGLGLAVVEGIGRARADTLVIMDADLSHPPEVIPEMLRVLDDGAELVIGSRYVAGGGTDADWHWWRLLNSRAATWLARPLTRVRDPMSGFLAFRRALVDAAAPLDPIGFKIGLELIVKCRPRSVREVPIQFIDRRHGESKLDLREQGRYLRHLARLYRHRLTAWPRRGAR